MALVDVDSWITEYEACERLNHTLLVQLTQREKRQPLSSEYNRLSAAITIGIKQFDRELKQLKEKLNNASSSTTITAAEIERRRRLADALNSQFNQLQVRFANTTREDRINLLNAPTNSASAWQVPTTSTLHTADIESDNVEALKYPQADILDQQNQGLETLSQTISRQRALATQFGQEVDDQNDILDNLSNTIERVESRVNVESGQIGLVTRQDSTYGYWIVILILFVAIVIVVLL